MKLPVSIRDREQGKFELYNGEINIRVLAKNIASASAALTQLQLWEMKGFTTIEQIENNYNFDFVTTGDCIFVVDAQGQFVVVRR
jgi:hypothetical protein